MWTFAHKRQILCFVISEDVHPFVDGPRQRSLRPLVVASLADAHQELMLRPLMILWVTAEFVIVSGVCLRYVASLDVIITAFRAALIGIEWTKFHYSSLQ
jgi:hypothetical protein